MESNVLCALEATIGIYILMQYMFIYSVTAHMLTYNHSVHLLIWYIHTHAITDDSLTLDSLLIQLRSQVTSKWYKFGLALGIAENILDKYVGYPSEECIVEMLDYWLRNHDSKPTWKDVAKALRDIELCQLAGDILNAYKTGAIVTDHHSSCTIILYQHLILLPCTARKIANWSWYGDSTTATSDGSWTGCWEFRFPASISTSQEGHVNILQLLCWIFF